jgi:hypothetical protein
MTEDSEREDKDIDLDNFYIGPSEDSWKPIRTKLIWVDRFPLNFESDEAIK